MGTDVRKILDFKNGFKTVGQGKNGIWVPEGALTNWKAARATAGSGLVNVVGWGDSIAAGYFSSNLITKGWMGKLFGDLQTKYGNGGSGFLSVMNANVTGFAHNGIGTSAGWTLDQTDSAMNETFLWSNTVGNTITISNLYGNTLDIWYGVFSGGGTFTYNVDSGAQTGTVNTSGAANSAVKTTVAMTGAGPHTVVLTVSNTGYSFISGVTGRNATGIIGHNMSASGRTSGHGVVASFASTAMPTSLTISTTNMNPSLGIIALGVNDIAAAVSMDTYYKNIGNMANAFKAYSSGVCDLIFVSDHRGTINADANVLYPKFCSAMHDLSRTFNAVWVNRWGWGRNSWAYWNGLGYWGTANATGAAGTDTVHPGDVGHAAIEQPIYDLLVAA